MSAARAVRGLMCVVPMERRCVWKAVRAGWLERREGEGEREGGGGVMVVDVVVGAAE